MASCCVADWQSADAIAANARIKLACDIHINPASAKQKRREALQPSAVAEEICS
jgi:hypothetical protein